MNILFLCHRIPFPPNKGDKIRSFQEIKYLGREHNLYLAFLIDDEQDHQYLEELKQYCTAFDYDVINPRWQKLKSLPSLVSGKPLSIPYFYSDRLQRAINKRLKESGIDAIVCFSSPMAEYVFMNDEYRGGNWNGIRLVMDFVDVDSDKWRLYAGFSSFPYSIIYRREWRRLREYEKMVGEAFDWSLFVSDKEVELFRSFCPTARAQSMANGVDAAYFAQSRNGVEGRGGNILFIGAMDYFPNEDAVVHFAEEIMPLVKREVPEAQFFVVGRKPSDRVKKLSASNRSIVVTGFVPDVRPYLADAAVFVAPLRIARGIQNKVLEAMAAGIPVVAHPAAVQGLAGHNGSVRVESNTADFARAVVECLTDGDRQRMMIAEARKYVAEYHDWGINLKGLERLLRS